MSDYVVEMLNITKIFPGIKANDNITLQLKKGEVHALLGENGAGKSTLMSVLFGLYQPEEGVIKINGQPVKINNPNDANALNIGMVSVFCSGQYYFGRRAQYSRCFEAKSSQRKNCGPKPAIWPECGS